MRINAVSREGQQKVVTVDQLPDKCPLCHYGINLVYIFAQFDSKRWTRDDCLQVVFRCPRLECSNLFISYYRTHDSGCNSFLFRYSRPSAEIEKDFSQTIRDISENFCEIDNQSFWAEQYELSRICGVGYRKSLEFLIKDYLIGMNPEKDNEIKSRFLGRCISDYIDNQNIKEIAKRATWLGNDETHYLRTWQDSDIQDLKRLIELTIHWIEMEQLTRDTIKDMPEIKSVVDAKEVLC